LKQAVELAGDDDPRMAEYLNDLGLSQMRRFARLGERTSDGDESISNLERAVELADADDTGIAVFLSNLGLSYSERFDRLGEWTDNDASINYLQKAIVAGGDDDDNMSTYLSVLGNSLMGRSARSNESKDLDASISILRSSVEIRHSVDNLNSLGLYMCCWEFTVKFCAHRRRSTTVLSSYLYFNPEYLVGIGALVGLWETL
jgi:hypothetical protein